MATVGQWTGRETRLLRHALRLTIRQFAEDLGVSVRTVSKWETNGTSRTPRPELQAALDTLFARATEEERLRFETACQSGQPARPQTAATAPGTAGVIDLRGQEPTWPGEPTVCLPLVVDGQPVLAPIDAFTLGGIGLGAFIGAAKPPVPDPLLPALDPDEHERLAALRQNPRRYADDTAVTVLTQQLEECKADDQAAGPAGTLPVVLVLLRIIDKYARDVTPDIRRKLLSLGARGAEFAGWLYRDLRSLSQAATWYDRATSWAQEAGDLPMQGYVLLKKSQMAYDERDALRVVTLGRAAHEGPWQLPGKVQAEVVQQSARGLAMTGATLDDVRRRLDDAHNILAGCDADDQNSANLATHYSPAQLRLQTASCYMEAGHPQMAADLYGEVLSGVHLQVRDRGYFLARRAHSLALAGRPDDAADTGLEAVPLAEATGSARSRRELERTVTVLQPWRNRPGPRDLREALSGLVS